MLKLELINELQKVYGPFKWWKLFYVYVCIWISLARMSLVSRFFFHFFFCLFFQIVSFAYSFAYSSSQIFHLLILYPTAIRLCLHSGFLPSHTTITFRFFHLLTLHPTAIRLLLTLSLLILSYHCNVHQQGQKWPLIDIVLSIFILLELMTAFYSFQHFLVLKHYLTLFFQRFTYLRENECMHTSGGRGTGRGRKNP